MAKKQALTKANSRPAAGQIIVFEKNGKAITLTVDRIDPPFFTLHFPGGKELHFTSGEQAGACGKIKS